VSDELESFEDEVEEQAEESEDESSEIELEYEGPLEPTPVEITSDIYDSIKVEYGEDVAFQLQEKWADRALENSLVAGAVVEDHPPLVAAIDNNITEHGVTLEGVSLMAEYVAKTSGFDDLEAMSKVHPELDHIFWDHFNESTNTLSMTGVYLALHYIGQRSGYRFTQRMI
jgi:hypothetical protein